MDRYFYLLLFLIVWVPVSAQTLNVRGGDLIEGSVSESFYEDYRLEAINKKRRVQAVLSGTGDPDLYLRIGSLPDIEVFNCRSISSGANEVCSIELPENEELFISVFGFTDATFVLEIKTEVVSSETSVTSLMAPIISLLLSEDESIVTPPPFSCIDIFSGDTIVGDVTVTDQNSIDNLEGVTIIDGELVFDTVDSTLNFQPLQSLVFVTRLRILQLDVDLNPISFPCLESVGANFEPDGFAQLTDGSTTRTIDGDIVFPMLNSVGSFGIFGTTDLTRVSGFSKLEFAGSLIFGENQSLISIDGFTSLADSQLLIFRRNSSLREIPIFSNLKPNPLSNTALEVIDNPLLMEVRGFETADITSLKIRSNTSLKTVSGFSSSFSDDSLVELVNNPQLTSIPIFNNLITSTGITLETLPVSPAFPEFRELTSNTISIKDLPSLPDFPKLERISGASSISLVNPALEIIGVGGTTLSGFPLLNFVSGSILIQGNQEAITMPFAPLLGQLGGTIQGIIGIQDNNSFNCISNRPNFLVPIRTEIVDGDLFVIGDNRVYSSSGNLLDCPDPDLP